MLLSFKKKRLLALVMAITLSGCNKNPTALTTNFLNDLGNRRFEDSKNLSLMPLQQQIDIIRQDRDALFNGQQWKYTIVKEIIEGDSAKVFFISKLHDGSRLHQTAILCKLNHQWKIANVVNTKIAYSSHALKTRTYADYGNQMLITTLDLEDITLKNITTCIGKYVMVSGYICSFSDTGKMVQMTMGQEDEKPLLTIMLEGKAANTAKIQYISYMETDAMLEEPLGKTFMVTGLIQRRNGKLSMKVSNAENIYIGQVLRIQKP